MASTQNTPPKECESCGNCKKSGLPVFPVRYTVFPKLTKGQIVPAPPKDDRVTKIGLTQHDYGQRILREGWLYLFYENGVHGNNYWEAYWVSPDGRFWKQGGTQGFWKDGHPAPLPVAKGQAHHCSQAGSAQTTYITIERPDRCSKRVYIAFSEHRWCDAVFRKYAQNKELREKRMQHIEPKAWLGKAADKEYARAATTEKVSEVFEYRGGCTLGQLAPMMHGIRGEKKGGNYPYNDGDYDGNFIGRESSLYTPVMRTGAAGALLTAMHDSCRGSDAQPVMLTLWDAVGTTHELNGFRNDAASMLVIYAKEYDYQIDALNLIEQAHAAVRNGAVAHAIQNAGEAAAQNYDLHNPLSMLTSRYDFGAGLPFAPTNQQLRQRADEYKREKAAWDCGRKVEFDKGADTVDPEPAAKLGEETWRNKYIDDKNKKSDYLDMNKYARFRARLDGLCDEVNRMQAQRSKDVGAWLKAALFIDTLNDYYDAGAYDSNGNPDKNALVDAPSFETVVNKAIGGLTSEAQGEKLVQDLVNNIECEDPSKSSLVWRAMACNQKNFRHEFQKLLKLIESKGDGKEDTSDGWIASHVTGPLNQIKGYAKFREKIATVIKSTGNGKVAKALEAVDGLINAISSPLYKWICNNAAGNFASSYLLRGVLLMRINVAEENAMGLVSRMVEQEPEMRDMLHKYYQILLRAAPNMSPSKLYSMALENLSRHVNVEREYDLWKKELSAGRLFPKGSEVEAGIRMSGTMALIEMISFWMLLDKNNRTTDENIQLASSGFSTVSACLQPTMKAVTAGIGEASAASLKMSILYLSGIASMLNAWADFRKGEEEREKGHTSAMTLYIGLIGLDLAKGVAATLTGLSISLPMIARLLSLSGDSRLVVIGSGLKMAIERSTVEEIMVVVGDRLTANALIFVGELALLDSNVIGLIILFVYGFIRLMIYIQDLRKPIN